MRGTGHRRREALALVVGLLALALGLIPLGGTATAGTGGVVKRLFAEGFTEPMYVARAPGVDDKIYVVERGGTVEVVVNGERQVAPFLTVPSVSTDGEGGLLSIAFDPAYQQNGLVYAYYTTNESHTINIAEFETTSDTDADEASIRHVLEIPHPNAQNHQGGTIAFGTDGYLYAATGDGGAVAARAQDRSSLLGKVLRIDPHGAADGDYTVPATNPFAGDIPGAPEILALGLRNPFRWSFDGRRMIIGDVGQGAFEEIDYETRGKLTRANFGWPRYEGTSEVDPSIDLSTQRYEPPIFQYSHASTPPAADAVTGGLVVRDERLTGLVGRYVYADHYVGDLRSLDPQLDGAANDQAVGVHVNGPVAFNVGPNRRVYVTSLWDGKVFRLAPG